jgi:hypothetical protein
VAITRAWGRSCARVTAMHPLPVPMSSTFRGSPSGIRARASSTSSSVSGRGITRPVTRKARRTRCSWGWATAPRRRRPVPDSRDGGDLRLPAQGAQAWPPTPSARASSRSLLLGIAATAPAMWSRGVHRSVAEPGQSRAEPADDRLSRRLLPAPPAVGLVLTINALTSSSSCRP